MLAGGVVPVVVMIDVRAIPAAITGLERRMVPLNTGVVTGYDPALATKAQGPDVWRTHPGDIPFNASRGSVNAAWYWQTGANHRIGIDLAYVGPRGKFLHQRQIARDLNHVHNIEGLI